MRQRNVKIGTTAFGILIVMFFGLRMSALAHGDNTHVMGTVTAISAKAITVQATDRDIHVVALNPKTTFKKSGAKAALADLKVGDRVVIEASGEENALTALSVQFGPARSAAKPVAKSSSADAHADHTDQKK